MFKQHSFSLVLAGRLTLGCAAEGAEPPPDPSYDEQSDALLPDICTQPAQAFAGLSYTGKVAWDAPSGRLAFLSSGRFPEGALASKHREFHFRPGPNVKTIVICKNVTVTGHFVADHQLTIRGRDRKTSVIYGTDVVDWSHAGGRHYNAWEYPAIAGVGSGATITVRNLTVRNARSYAGFGWDQRSVVERGVFIHVRPNDDNGSNSDGVQGAGGAVLRDSYFNVGDDAIKLYNDMTVENVVIDLQRNGAPIQLGWDRFGSRSAKGTFKNLTINGVSNSGQYNLGVFSWVSDGGAGGVKTVDIDGFVVNGLQLAKRWNGDGWEPYPLVQVGNVSAGQLRVNINGARVATGQFGKTTRTGDFVACGSRARAASYSCP